jgi:hypothetical protein
MPRSHVVSELGKGDVWLVFGRSFGSRCPNVCRARPEDLSCAVHKWSRGLVNLSHDFLTELLAVIVLVSSPCQEIPEGRCSKGRA